MRVLVRTSKLAVWSRRFGSFALPVAIIPVIMHRERLIDSGTFQLIETVAIALALVALVLAIAAVARLWVTGDQGWGKALMGLFFSLICLLPVGAGAAVAMRYPPVTDITTDRADPPILMSGLLPPDLDSAMAARVAQSFPNAQTRTYRLAPNEVFVLANALALARGWDIRLRRAPQTELDEGQLNAISMTLLGWRDEVSIRFRGFVEGTEVAMRSASLSGFPDLGGNGSRIEEFLAALDLEVTTLIREMPAADPAP